MSRLQTMSGTRSAPRGPAAAPGAAGPALHAQRPLAAPLLASQALLTAPFDALRWSYAAAVQTGLVRRSLLASGAFERTLGRAEQFTLGPLARCV